MPSPEVRAVAALLRYHFKGFAIFDCAERADEIAPDDREAADVIAAVASWVSASNRD